MAHPAIKSELFKLAMQYLKDGVAFVLENEYHEIKDFIPNSAIYNANNLRSFFKLGYDIDEPIVRVYKL